MRKIFTILLLVTCQLVQAQNLIAVEHNGVSTFFTNLDTAVTTAQTGDNVYIPGGSFALTVPISKGYNLIGVGYNPDSTTAAGFTQLTSASNVFYIITGADNGSITGINFGNFGLYFGSSATNQTVNNYLIRRCRLGNILLGQGAAINDSKNIVLNENVIDGNIYGYLIKGAHISNNIIGGGTLNLSQGNEFVNNVFLATGSGYYTFQSDSNSIFRNNIFLFTFNLSINSAYNTFYNNLFVISAAEINLPGIGVGDIFNVVQSSIFVNQSGNAYDYHQNYHLKSTCPGKNYGTDGTDLGVYGTATPWKEGGLPYNPHIQFQSIASQTDGNGNLSVNIKVAAQKN